MVPQHKVSSCVYVLTLLVAFHYLVFRDYHIQFLASLDTKISDTNILEFCMSTNTGRKFDTSLRYSGPFVVQNEPLIASLDEIVRLNFSSTLLDELGAPPFVEKAALAGGYAHLLCSSTVTTEHAWTFLKGFTIGKSEGKLNLEAHFKYLLASRLIKLFGEVLNTRKSSQYQRYGKTVFPGWSPNAYAASVVLLYEIQCFNKRLNNGNLFGFGEVCSLQH
jgi:hypothetical protein